MKKIFLFALVCSFAVLIAGGMLIIRAHNWQPRPQSTAKLPQIKVTILEGWTLNDIAKDLDYNSKRGENAHLADSQDFLSAAGSFSTKNYPLLDSKPANQGLEGFLFPDTYFVPLPSASTSLSTALIKKALDNFSQKFTPDMEAAAKARSMSIYQIVTLASIVEKETGRNAVTDEQLKNLQEERKIIAGIFYNRLSIDMPLQSDATVNYITKKNTPSASASDIAIDSPYNTYKYKGLPPGPIANPSLSSLMAVIYPTQTNYFYFLHKQPSGEPVYSQTFEEHIQNEQKYLR